MKRDYYVTPKSGKIMRMLWQAAGGDRYILERATYGDQVKYMCLGGVVLATGIMAGLAGGYAIYTIFEPRGSAIESQFSLTVAAASMIFGCLWGLMIFNIDRFIVTSTGKGDGTEKITRDEFVGAIPRIIMGAIIAITISKPIEIRMFKTEIDVKLHEKQIEQQQIYTTKTDSLFNSELAKKDKELVKFENALSEKIKRHAELERQYIEEARIITVGPRALAVKAQMERVQGEIEQDVSHPEYVRLKSEKNVIEKRREAALQISGKVAAGLDGLLERIKLAHEIAGWTITLFIMALFLAIELTPIFFKLMLTKTPYDYLDENIKELIKAENGIEVRYDFYKDKKGQERHLVINHEVERVIYEKHKATQAQKLLTKIAVQAYIKKMTLEIEANPEKFIKTQENGFPTEIPQEASN